MATEDDVRRIALSLPETSERSSYGTPGFRVKDTLFARIREAGVLAVHCADEQEKHALIASQPATFYTTPHYDGYPMVLVRLPAVADDELRELLIEGWLARAPKRVRATHAGALGVELD